MFLSYWVFFYLSKWELKTLKCEKSGERILEEYSKVVTLTTIYILLYIILTAGFVWICSCLIFGPPFNVMNHLCESCCRCWFITHKCSVLPIRLPDIYTNSVLVYFIQVYLRSLNRTYHIRWVLVAWIGWCSSYDCPRAGMQCPFASKWLE